VIVVDDGGSAPTVSLDHWTRHYPLTLIRQAHAGISAARNRGVRDARGTVLLFVDADCRLQPDCLAVLAAAVDSFPRQNSFQLRLVGNCSRLVGRAQTLRLATLQDQLLEPNGCIRYLDTAGAAIRRAKVDFERGLFDVRARRGEDTLLLTELMQDGELPLFVAGAVVQHAISLSVLQYFVKAVRSAYVEGQAFDIIASKGIKIRVSHRKRLTMLLAMWRLSRQHSIGRAAWFVIVVGQTLSRITSYLYRLSRSLKRLFPGLRSGLSRPKGSAGYAAPTAQEPEA
jgi:glycosyltransferase involved in cell wall biosynthesis